MLNSTHWIMLAHYTSVVVMSSMQLGVGFWNNQLDVR